MKSVVNKIWIGLALLVSAQFAQADIWKPMNAGLDKIPLISSAGSEYVAVVAGGKFDEFGKEYTLRIWNGFSWGHEINFTTDSFAQIRAMQSYNGSIYFAGVIHKVKGLSNVYNIFRFNLKERIFQSITGDATLHLMKEINAIEIYKNTLVVAGTFSKIQNVLSNNLIFYNGSVWSYPGLDFGTGFDGPVTELVVANDTLFAGGFFKNADQLFSQYYAAYINGTWLRFENNTAPVNAMAYTKGALISGSKDGGRLRIFSVLRSGQTAMDSGITEIYAIRQIIVHNGELWASGLFLPEKSTDPINLMRFRDGKWHPAPGAEYMKDITTMVSTRGKLFAGGRIIEPTLGIRNMAEYAPGTAVIQGRVYFDKNNNCTFDNRDEFLSRHLVVIQPGNLYAKPNGFGQYRIFVPPGKYEVTTVEQKYWTFSPCQSTHAFQATSGSIHDSVDFAMTYREVVEDIKVNLTAAGGWQARNGQPNAYILQYSNVGSEIIHAGKLELQFHEELGAGFQSEPAPDSLFTDRAVWLYTGLPAGENRQVAINVEIPGTFTQDHVSYQAIAEPTPNEAYTEDNQSGLSQTITDSTFANEKQIYPSPANGESYAVISTTQREVAFNISFANYSYDTVRTIYVIDTLDTDLDIEYIQETGSEHNYTTKVLNGPPGSNTAIVIWTFEDINLNPNPSRANDMFNYSGFIGFKFRFNSDLPEGLVITNRAKIIFDYEHEEMTNTVEGRVQKVSSTGVSVLRNDYTVYPNPVTTGKIYVDIGQEFDISETEVLLVDMLGRIWKPANVKQSNAVLDVSLPGLPSGTYTLLVADLRSGTRVACRLYVIH